MKNKILKITENMKKISSGKKTKIRKILEEYILLLVMIQESYRKKVLGQPILYFLTVNKFKVKELAPGKVQSCLDKDEFSGILNNKDYSNESMQYQIY